MNLFQARILHQFLTPPKASLWTANRKIRPTSGVLSARWPYFPNLKTPSRVILALQTYFFREGVWGWEIQAIFQ
jgi:hypothetical protein